MKEAYVSYETAKLLKEKGFDWDCTSHFDSNHIECPNTPMNFNSTKYWVSRPTHQMACAWLREMSYYHIQVGVFGIDKGHERTDEWKYFYEIIFPRTFTIEYDSRCYNDGYSTYDEAVENGIKYTLENLI